MRNKSQDELPSVKIRIGDVLAKLARFTPDFMAAGRGQNQEAEREKSPELPLQPQKSGSAEYAAEISYLEQARQEAM